MNDVILNDISNSYQRLLPNLPQNLPQEPYDFEPKIPHKHYNIPKISARATAKKIYVLMLNAIKLYSKLLRITPSESRKTIDSLKSQMEILSVSMLNIYQNIAGVSKIPFYAHKKSKIPRTYIHAISKIYDNVYYIHQLVLRLFAQNVDTQTSAMLLIVLTNLKSQLKTLDSLKSK